MTPNDSEFVRSVIENEGFDYAFRGYTNFPEVKDKEFHKLRQQYMDAADALSSYLGLDD